MPLARHMRKLLTLPAPKVPRLTLIPIAVPTTGRALTYQLARSTPRQEKLNCQRCGAIPSSTLKFARSTTLVSSKIQPVGGRLGTLFALEQNLDQTWQKHCKSELGLHPSILFPVISSSSAIDQTEYQFITDFEVREPV